MPKRSTPGPHRFEITAPADRHALEALQLEIRRLAREHGLEVTEVLIAAEDATARGPAPRSRPRGRRPATRR
jgi:hypothetical protein